MFRGIYNVIIVGLLILIAPLSVYAAAGDVWIQPSSTSVSTNSAFTLEVHADTGAEKLGAYQFTVTFDSALINIDTAQGTDGVAAGTDGFIAAVNTDNTNGTITVNGFDVTGTGLGSNLQVLIIYFDALDNVGESTIGLTVNTLANELGDTIGTPNGTGGSITVVVNDPPSTPELVYPSNGQTGLGTTVEFKWKKSTDPDGDTVTYDLYVCEDEGFTTGCKTKEGIVASSKNLGIYYAGSFSGAGLLIFGIALAGSLKGRRKIALLIAMIMITGMLLVSCGGGNDNGDDDNGGDTSDEVSYTVSGLSPGTTYHWKVVAKDGNGGETGSEVRNFTTQ